MTTPAATPMSAPRSNEVPEVFLALPDWGVIRAAGADAGAFLQGQLTSDVQGLAMGEARLAGYCSPKGRLLASFVVWREDAESYLLACSADLLAATLKRLSMFVLRAKCKLQDASSSVPLWGWAEPAAQAADVAASARSGRVWPAQVWARQTSTIRLPDARLGVRRISRALCLEPPTAPMATADADADAWRWLEALAATPRIVAATTDRFVPQMVNFELVGGVSFSKGCYPGQEVVARSQYRGTLKRRSFVVECSVPLVPGQELFHDSDPSQPAGMVVNSGSHAGHHAALVELKLAALDAAGELHAGDPGGANLRLLEQPYPLPAADAA